MVAKVVRAALVVCVLGCSMTADSAMAALGDLTQKPGLSGCLSETGDGPCTDATGLQGAFSLALGPGGTNAYVAGLGSSALSIYDRSVDGTLAQKPGTSGCISDTGSDGACADGFGLPFPASVVVSPDGRNVYMSADRSVFPNVPRVTVFDRAADGTVTQKQGKAGCLSDDGEGGLCTQAEYILGGLMAISPDGRSVYVVGGPAGSPGAIAVFDRGADGTLTQKTGLAACISTVDDGDCVVGRGIVGARDVKVSADGRSVYVASNNDSVNGQSSGVAIFDRAADGTLTQKPGTAGCISETGGGGECVDGRGLGGALTVTISPDDRNVYVAGRSNAVAVFDRAADGSLTQKPGDAGCVSPTDNDQCASAVGFSPLVVATAVSPDGTSFYVGSNGAIAVFTRAADGTITQRSGAAACISDAATGGPCARATPLQSITSLTVSADGRSVYATPQTSNSVVVFDRQTTVGDEPVAATGAASSITSTGAAVSGTVNPTGLPTSYTFEYGTSLSFGGVVPVGSAGAGGSPVTLTSALSGLAPATTYDYRVVATNSAGTAVGAARSFRTIGGSPVAPDATTVGVQSIGPDHATVRGTVNPRNQQTSFTFEYGTTTSFGSIAPVVALDAADEPEPVATVLTGLARGTTYFYRVVATNATGTSFGTVGSFTTAGGNVAPLVMTGAASAVSATGATLAATVDPRGQRTAFTFEYGPTNAFGSVTAVDYAGDTTGSQAVSLPVTGLTPGTTYLFRVVATNAIGTSAGAVGSFTTTGGA
jgi:hypothetical protein